MGGQAACSLPKQIPNKGRTSLLYFVRLDASIENQLGTQCRTSKVKTMAKAVMSLFYSTSFISLFSQILSSRSTKCCELQFRLCMSFVLNEVHIRLDYSYNYTNIQFDDSPMHSLSPPTPQTMQRNKCLFKAARTVRSPSFSNAFHHASTPPPHKSHREEGKDLRLLGSQRRDLFNLFPDGFMRVPSRPPKMSKPTFVIRSLRGRNGFLTTARNGAKPRAMREKTGSQ